MADNRTGLVIGGIGIGIGLLCMFCCCGAGGVIFSIGASAARTKAKTIVAHNELTEYGEEWSTAVQTAKERDSIAGVKSVTHDFLAQARLIDISETDKDYQVAYKKMLVKLEHFARILDKAPASTGAALAFAFTDKGGFEGLKRDMDRATAELQDSMRELDRIAKGS